MCIVDSDSARHGESVFGLVVRDPSVLQTVELDALVITLNEEKETPLREYPRLDSRRPKVIMAGAGHLEYANPLYSDVLSSCLVSSRAAGYRFMLVHIYQSLEYIKSRGLVGDIAEFGVYKGGTTVFIAKTLQRLDLHNRIHAFDTFEGFPGRKHFLDLYESGHDEFYDYQTVRDYCKPYDINLVKGDICETYRLLADVPLVLTFFDTDNYSPTRAALELCCDQTVPGGVLAFDHQYCDLRWLYTIGERIAATEVLDDRHFFNLHGTGIFLKI
jgi:hypothetical protein